MGKNVHDFAFLKMNDIDRAWIELLQLIPVFDNEEEKKRFDKLLKYLNDFWIKTNSVFPKEIWNLHDQDSHRTNNITETYNKKLNGSILKPKPNIYNLVDIIKSQEALTSVAYERANLGEKNFDAQRMS